MTRILRKREIHAVTGLSLTTIWRLEKAGEFPARVQLTERITGWREDEVTAWLKMRNRAPLSGSECAVDAEGRPGAMRRARES
ncbi:MAG: AlpA family phage regulatory protein [Candidatus Eisenbacteria sp.]|nr:AlpA family phage regulatory protein [Candidatus Eisenbacteria bacterium]